MKQVVIMRGPSGAGKGAWIENNLPAGTFIASADDFFMQLLDMNAYPAANCIDFIDVQPTFEYKFDVSKLSEAHATCMANFLKALRDGVETIVVDNTNIKHWQFESYVLAAEIAGYDVRVVSIVGFTVEDIKMCARRNVHGTPIDVVAKMFLEFEPYDGEEVVMIGGADE
jgi:predicted kinase